jgi:hypothetical protein
MLQRFILSVPIPHNLFRLFSFGAAFAESSWERLAA